MMKTKPVPTLKRVRPRNSSDIYYTYSHWQAREIDGVEYVPVNKFMPSQERTQQIHYLRKDSLEYIK